MVRILFFMKKKWPQAISAPLLGLFSIIFKRLFIGIYTRSQVSVYRTIGPLVFLLV